MDPQRVLALALRILRQLSHDRRTVLLLTLAPILIMIMFGYGFGGEIENITVILVDEDRSDFSEALVRELEQDRRLNPVYTSTESEAKTAVENGEVWGAIVIPDGFQQGVISGGSDLRLALDGSNPQITRVIEASALEVLLETTQQYFGFTLPVQTAVSYVYAEGLSTLDAAAPAVMGFAAMFFTFLLTIVSLVKERTTGTMERILASPLDAGEIVLGYTLAFSVVALAQVTLILVAAILLFQVTIAGNILLVYGFIYIFAVGSLGLGILLSTAAKSEFQAIQFFPMYILPSILLSGMFWPIEAIPEPFNLLSYLVPLTYLNELLRSEMLRGTLLSDSWIYVLALLAYTSLTLLLSSKVFRREVA